MSRNGFSPFFEREVHTSPLGPAVTCRCGTCVHHPGYCQDCEPPRTGHTCWTLCHSGQLPTKWSGHRNKKICYCFYCISFRACSTNCIVAEFAPFRSNTPFTVSPLVFHALRQISRLDSWWNCRSHPKRKLEWTQATSCVALPRGRRKLEHLRAACRPTMPETLSDTSCRRVRCLSGAMPSTCSKQSCAWRSRSTRSESCA